MDKNMQGWDHKVSADPAELKVICTEAKRIHAALGSGNPELSPEEKKKMDHFRRSIVTSKAVKKGDVLSLDNLFFKRPGTGIKPNELKYVLNRTARRDIPADELVNWDDLL
jgi:N-acetylneuraminate synthase